MIESLIQTIHFIVSTLNTTITQMLNGNTIIAGAVTASIIASVFYVLRKVPSQLWYFVRKHLLFSYAIEYRPGDDSGMINDIAERFEYEIQKRVSKKRHSARLTARKKRIVETLSDGGFYYIYQGIVMFISRSRETSQAPGAGSSPGASNHNPLVTLSFTTLWYNRRKITEMLSETAKEYVTNGVFQVLAPSWSNAVPGVARVRNFTSIPMLAIDAMVKEKIDSAIRNFLNNREKHNANDEPHKLVFMLYGEPGTGKSALGEYIAYAVKASLFCVNGRSVSHQSGLGLSDIVRSAANNVEDNAVPVILCDDFDTIWPGLIKRKKVINSDTPSEEPTGDGPSPQLGRMLTDLQSPTEIRDVVVVFTTNHLEMIDPAMYRPGRVTVMIEVGRMQPRSVMEYFEMCYGHPWPENTPIERALRGCDVSDFYNTNQNNPHGFIDAVLSEESSADEGFQEKTAVLVS